MTAEARLILARPDARIAYRRIGAGPSLLLLHATLSSARQLRPLAARLGSRFGVLSVDRRGSGESSDGSGQPPRPIDVAVHVDDLQALVEAEGLGACVVVGHSYGGCLGLELAARRPGLVRALWVFEPPYAPVAPAAVRERMAEAARRTLRASELQGPAAAAEVFMAAVSGQAAVAALTPAALERIHRAGSGAVADAPLLGLDAGGLSGIECPVAIATGTASQPLYVAIAEGLAERIGSATVERLTGADHMAPLRRPDIIAAAVEAFVDR